VVKSVVAIAARGDRGVIWRAGLFKGVLLPMWRCRFAAEDSGSRVAAPKSRWDWSMPKLYRFVWSPLAH